MLADFAPVERDAWRYRELYWECGVVGQVLYLEAEAAGIRATGIGCFFDDAMHACSACRPAAQARGRGRACITSPPAGAVDDQRLATLPPYSFAPRSRVAPPSR